MAETEEKAAEACQVSDVISQPKPELDTLTGRPRTPNDPYTELTDVQLSNLQKNARPLFHISKREKPFYTGREGGRHYKDLYCNSIDSNLVRAGGLHGTFNYIDELHSRHPAPEYDTCRSRASVRWGPNKAGERTRSHFFGESIDRYTNIDMYRRPPTNYPGRVVMDCGRPGDGYYAQRFPTRSTWFLSSTPLNQQQTMSSVYPKTWDQHERVREAEKMARADRLGKWPEFSEYTDRYTLCAGKLPEINS